MDTGVVDFAGVTPEADYEGTKTVLLYKHPDKE